MKYITALVTSGTVSYVPAPCRGTVNKVLAVWQTSSVTANDTVTLARNTTTVNLVTASSGDGLVVETGVRDTTNGDLVFDPASSTTTDQVIKVTVSAGGACLVLIFFDESAYVQQAASEA
jgi:hypothetical protein